MDPTDKTGKGRVYHLLCNSKPYDRTSLSKQCTNALCTSDGQYQALGQLLVVYSGYTIS